MENKIQRTMKKEKSTIPNNAYSKLYLSGSYPSKFYGTAKMQKLSTNKVDDLPHLSIVPNIGKATYQTVKCLTKLLLPLGTSEYTINNIKCL